MTITQRIISQNEPCALENFDINGKVCPPQFAVVSDADAFGAGALVCACFKSEDFAKENLRAVRVQLDGAPKEDFSVSEFIPRLLKLLDECPVDLTDKSVEFGGDSLSYLYVEERYEIAKALFEKCANCIFEADYLTVEHLQKMGARTLPAVFADGEWDYEKVLTVFL